MSGTTGAVSSCPPAPRDCGGSPEPGSRAGAAFQRWPLADTLPLGSLPGAVPCAWLHTRHILKEWNLDRLAENAELIVSELVTNALHASRSLQEAPPIGLRLLASGERLMVEVWDAQPTPPDPQPHEIDADGGRGLKIVSLLSDQWGHYHPTSGGKVVWAILAAHLEEHDHVSDLSCQPGAARLP